MKKTRRQRRKREDKDENIKFKMAHRKIRGRRKTRMKRRSGKVK